MWLPLVITSTPASREPRGGGGVTPNPAAAFSTLATTRSTWNSLRRRGRKATRTRRPGSPNTSPTHRTVNALSRISSSVPEEPAPSAEDSANGSAGELGRAVLPDHRHLDVAGVLHFGLDPLGDVLRELVGGEVGDLLRSGDDPELAASLDRVRRVHALERARDVLHCLDPLDVALEHLAPGARARGPYPVGGLDEDRLDRLRLRLVVARQNRVQDRPRLVVFRQELYRQVDVAPLLLVGQRLAHGGEG